VEERRSWLPAGLESPRLEPDDRASQRREGNGGKRSEGPSAAGGQDADDREPTPRRGRSETSSRRSRKQKVRKAKGRRPKLAGVKSEGPKAKERVEHGGERRGPSDVDAMGQDKHRNVVGQRYGLSRARQFLFYGIFLAFVVAAYIGLKAAADSLDKAPAHDTDQAPWSKPGAPQGPLGGFEPRNPGQKGPTHFQ